MVYGHPIPLESLQWIYVFFGELMTIPQEKPSNLTMAMEL
jgi:hypothetical protein